VIKLSLGKIRRASGLNWQATYLEQLLKIPLSVVGQLNCRDMPEYKGIPIIKKVYHIQ